MIRNTIRLAALLLCALPLGAMAQELSEHGFKPAPAVGDWWCYSDGAQATVYVSGIANAAAFQTDAANAFSQALGQRYGYKGGANCTYMANGSETQRKTAIASFRASGKTVIDTGWTVTVQTIAASPTVLPPLQTAPPPTAETAPAGNKNPFVCVADTASVPGAAADAPLYVTAPFDVAMPPPGVVHAWRSHLADQYHVTTDSANCSRRNEAQRAQLETRLAKAGSRVVRVDWKP